MYSTCLAYISSSEQVLVPQYGLWGRLIQDVKLDQQFPSKSDSDDDYAVSCLTKSANRGFKRALRHEGKLSRIGNISEAGAEKYLLKIFSIWV